MRWRWWRKPVVEEAVVPSCCWFDDDDEPTQIIWVPPRAPRSMSIGEFTTIAPAPGRHAR